MEIHFRLNGDPNKEGRQMIHLDINYGKELYAPKGIKARLQISTGCRVHPDNWETAKERVNTKEKGAADLNRRINDTRRRIDDIHSHFTYTRQPLDKNLFTELIRSDKKITEALQETGNTAESIKDAAFYWEQARRIHKNEWSENYERILVNAHNHLMRYRTGVMPAEITENFVKEFFAHLTDLRLNTPEGKRLQGVANNSLGIIIKYLRAVLKQAGLPYAWLKDKYYTEAPKTQHTWAEVMQLWNLDLSNIPVAKKGRPQVGLEESRDVYVFVCLTGPRFSDASIVDKANIKKTNIDGQPVTVLTYEQVKSKQTAQVALHPIAEAIIRKYKGKQKGLLPAVSNKNYNLNIKKIGKLAGLDREVKRVSYIGKKRVEETVPLWKVMSSHMARSTWATNLLAAGADITDVQAAGGWSDLATVRKYAKTREEQLHRKTLNAWKTLEAESEV